LIERDDAALYFDCSCEKPRRIEGIAHDEGVMNPVEIPWADYIIIDTCQ